MDLGALWLTVRLASATTLFLMLLATPLAWWIVQRRGVWRALVQAVVALPLVLPPTVIGFYLLVELGPLTRAGGALTRLLGHSLAFSFAGLLVGSMLYSLPFAVQPMVAGFQSLGVEYGEAASVLGASPLQIFFEITLPLTWPALISAAVLTFMHTVGEFGVVLMMGGDIPGVTRTLSIVLFDEVQDGRYMEAKRTALLLITMAVVALFTVDVRRPWRRIV